MFASLKEVLKDLTISGRRPGVYATASEALAGPLAPFFPAPFAALFFAAQRFLRAATIAARPSALSLRFGFPALAAGAFSEGADSPLILAQRALCDSAIRLRAAALN